MKRHKLLAAAFVVLIAAASAAASKAHIGPAAGPADGAVAFVKARP